MSLKRKLLRWLLLLDILAAIGETIWVSGSSVPPWLRMLLCGLGVGIAVLATMHLTFALVHDLLASCKEDD